MVSFLPFALPDICVTSGGWVTRREEYQTEENVSKIRSKVSHLIKDWSRHRVHHYEERVIFFIRHFSTWSQCFLSCVSRSALVYVLRKRCVRTGWWAQFIDTFHVFELSRNMLKKLFRTDINFSKFQKSRGLTQWRWWTITTSTFPNWRLSFTCKTCIVREVTSPWAP